MAIDTTGLPPGATFGAVTGGPTNAPTVGATGGVTGGLTNAPTIDVAGGVTGGLTNAPTIDVTGGVTGEIADWVTGGVTGGLTGGVTGGVTGDLTVTRAGTGAETGATAATGEHARPRAAAAGPLKVGQSFGPRYHIIKLLGVGGMGAVYQAWDAELSVAVALKVIRVDRRRGASPEAEKRFKNELLLARQVTHKNVVRIHDLGEIDAVKYITMPYVQGDDLATVLRRDGKLPVARALGLARQIVSGLEAAHDAGVVHRDLKPANIMIGAEDQALIMDFGISASTDKAASDGVVGTLEYMAPEQGTGEAVDARADIYAFGLILYEMLVGPRPAPSGTPQTRIEAMKQRFEEGLPSVRRLDPSMPIALDAFVTCCLERDPAARFQTTAELVADLDRLDDNGELIPIKRVVGMRIVAAGVTLALALLAGTWYFASRPAPPARAPLPVLIANFDNRANDPLFEGTLEQALGIGIEGASFITAYPRRDALRVAAEMKAGSTLDESVARLVAVREGIKIVLSGSIEPKGEKYAVTVKAEQPDGKIISNAVATASSKTDVLRVVGSLASRMRRDLGDTAPSKPGEIETFTTVSLEAAHAYALGQDNQGKPAEAVRYYQQAVALDPNLGRAYAGLAAAHVNLKKQEEASQYYKKALTLVDRMTEREKYRTLGTYHLTFASNYEQAVETLRQLVSLYPADGTGWNNLATAYSRVGNMIEAANASRRATEITPGNLLRRYNYAVNSMLAGDFTTAINQAEQILKIDNGFVYAYLPLALSTLIRGDSAKAEEIYGRLEKVSSEGASLSKMGQADLQMYGGRYLDAAKTLGAAIVADEKEGSGERAYKLVALAETSLALGRKADAVSAADKALQANALDDGIHFQAARVLVEAGEERKAEKLAADLESKLQKQTRSLALLIRGDVALKRHRLADAIDAYRDAQKQHDSWISHLLLGNAYVEAGHFAEALTQLEASDKRAGEATDLFGSNTTTLRYLPPIYYSLGRAEEGLGASDAARKSYQRFAAIREHADPTDKLLADAKRRAGQ